MGSFAWSCNFGINTAAPTLLKGVHPLSSYQPRKASFSSDFFIDCPFECSLKALVQ